MQHQPYRGFTLIELLVVIAIIGVLSAIVFASLAIARTRGADSSVKLGIGEVRSQIELDAVTINNNDYGNTFTSGTCPTISSPPNSIFYVDSKVRTMLASISAGNGYGNMTCASGGSVSTAASSWAVASPLPSLGSGGTWWCADSSGRSKLSFAAHHKGFLETLLTLTTPTTLAAIGVGPSLGGGASPALCP